MRALNTCIGCHTDLEIPDVRKAQEYLIKTVESRYVKPPHLTYALCPLPEYNLEKIKMEMDKYFSEKKSLKFKLGKVEFEEKNGFFSMAVESDELFEFHKALTNIFRKYREDFVREKDLIKYNEGKLSEIEMKYLEEYGYFRILDNFHLHITVGKVEKEVPNMNEVRDTVFEMLDAVQGTPLLVDNVCLIYYEDSDHQEFMKELYSKNYNFSYII